MEHPTLEELVQEIKAGKRVILFPPGMLSFLGVVFTSIPATVLCSVVLINAFAKHTALPIQAGLQFCGILFLLVFTVVPGLLLFRGKKKAAAVMRFTLKLLALTSLLLMILSFTDSNPSFFQLPITLSLGVSIFGVWISHTPQFQLITEFFYLLRKTN